MSCFAIEIARIKVCDKTAKRSLTRPRAGLALLTAPADAIDVMAPRIRGPQNMCSVFLRAANCVQSERMCFGV